MIDYKELRCGNLHYYHIEDKFDERKAWDQLAIIDPTDLQHLKEYPDDADYKPVPISEEWLIRAGFGESHNGWYKSPIACSFDYIGEKTAGIWVVMDMELPEIKWVHQLQNLVFALTGEELTFKDIDQ